MGQNPYHDPQLEEAADGLEEGDEDLDDRSDRRQDEDMLEFDDDEDEVSIHGLTKPVRADPHVTRTYRTWTFPPAIHLSTWSIDSVCLSTQARGEGRPLRRCGPNSIRIRL